MRGPDRAHDGLAGAGCLVLGVSSPHGAAVARRLATAGATVAIGDRRMPEADALANELGTVPVYVDRRNPYQVAQALELTRQRAPRGLVGVIDCVTPPSSHPLMGPDGPVALSGFQQLADGMVVGTVNVLRMTLQAFETQSVRAGVYGALADSGHEGWARTAWATLVRHHANELGERGIVVVSDENGLLAALAAATSSDHRIPSARTVSG